MKWIWPDIVDEASARAAVKPGIIGAWFIVAANTIVSLMVPRYGAVATYNSSVLLDAAVFAVVGWRLMRMSRGWAVAALAFWTLEIGDKIAHHASTITPVTVILLLAFVSAIRGTFAFHRLTSAAPAPVSHGLS